MYMYLCLIHQVFYGMKLKMKKEKCKDPKVQSCKGAKSQSYKEGSSEVRKVGNRHWIFFVKKQGTFLQMSLKSATVWERCKNEL